MDLVRRWESLQAMSSSNQVSHFKASAVIESFKQVLKGHARRYDLITGTAVVLGHIGAGVASALCCHGLWTAPFSGARGCALLVYPLVWLFIGTRMRALGNILHETAHGTYFERKVHNEILGRLIASLDGQTFERYRRKHWTHHAHLGVESLDLDFAERRTFRFDRKDPFPFKRHVLMPLTLFHIKHYLRYSFSLDGGVDWVRAFQLGVLGLTLWFALAGGAVALFLFVFIPYVSSYQILRYWSDSLDHAQLLGEAESFDRARNHLFASNLLNLFFFPRNDGYHLVHHLFPNLPARSFPDAHALLLSHPLYAERNHAFTYDDESFETLRS